MLSFVCTHLHADTFPVSAINASVIQPMSLDGGPLWTWKGSVLHWRLLQQRIAFTNKATNASQWRGLHIIASGWRDFWCLMLVVFFKHYLDLLTRFTYHRISALKPCCWRDHKDMKDGRWTGTSALMRSPYVLSSQDLYDTYVTCSEDQRHFSAQSTSTVPLSAERNCCRLECLQRWQFSSRLTIICSHYFRWIGLM